MINEKQLIRMFHALANEHRLRVFLLLSEGELCVCEIERIMKMKQSRISHMMRKLSSAGLTLSRREGKWIIYSVNPRVKESPVIKSLFKEAGLSDKDIKELKRCREKGPRAL